jgi:hypothetical protein
MAVNRKVAGSRTVDRLTAREDRYNTGDLREESVAGGGKVIRGELASRALEVLGARAMTLDRSVIVSDDFDMQNIEDQALFAHEQYHAMYGDGDGGGGGSNFRDAEEIAARAVERMVLSRAAKGGYEAGGGGATRGIGGHGHSHVAGDSAGGGTAAAGQETKDETDDQSHTADRGYNALREQGWSHIDIVDFLTRKAMQAAEESQNSHNSRFGDIKGTL